MRRRSSEKLFGIGWLSKHFKLRKRRWAKVFLQFDGMRQAGRFFLNGNQSVNMRTHPPLWDWISPIRKYGGKDNVIAVKV